MKDRWASALVKCPAHFMKWVLAIINACINNVVLEPRIYVARFAGSVNALALFTHSLRSGLEEYRQLRWLEPLACCVRGIRNLSCNCPGLPSSKSQLLWCIFWACFTGLYCFSFFPLL